MATPQTVLTGDTGDTVPIHSSCLRSFHFAHTTASKRPLREAACRCNGEAQRQLKGSLICCVCSVCDGQSQQSHAQLNPHPHLTLLAVWPMPQAWHGSRRAPSCPHPAPSLGPWPSLEPFNQLVQRSHCGLIVVSLSPHTINKFIHILITLHLYLTNVCLEPMSFQGNPVLLRMHLKIGVIVNISQMHLPPEGEVSPMERAVLQTGHCSLSPAGPARPHHISESCSG